MLQKTTNTFDISVIVPTFNSDRKLTDVLSSIKRQNYPAKKVEVLIIDGGSRDQTLQITKKFKCKIINNKRRLQVYARHIGLLAARGKYVIHLDSDEVLDNRNSFKEKVETFKINSEVKAVFPAGINTPDKSPAINHLINEFGDPFSFFMYGVSTNPEFLLPRIQKISNIIYEDDSRIIASFSNTKVLPPLELSAIGVAVERDWVINQIPLIKTKPELVSQAFYYLVQQDKLIGFTKNDTISHYSVAGTSDYLKKLRARVINNTFITTMGKSAFSGREDFYPPTRQFKKYLFILYSLSLIMPLIDGIILWITRKRIIYLSYPILCLYVVFLTAYYFTIKVFGGYRNLYAWGK